MNEEKDNPFLDDPETAAAVNDEIIDITSEEALEIKEEPTTSPFERVKALTEERDGLQDRLMRTLAEVENIRKRSDRDRREAEQYGGSRLARDLLPVFDYLKRGLDAAGDAEREAAGPVIEGVELTLKELLNVFSRHGISMIAPEKGEKFDPQLHQAMFETPVPGTPQGEIIELMAEGFTLHDRLLRAAQVGVSSAPPPES